MVSLPGETIFFAGPCLKPPQQPFARYIGHFADLLPLRSSAPCMKSKKADYFFAQQKYNCFIRSFPPYVF